MDSSCEMPHSASWMRRRWQCRCVGAQKRLGTHREAGGMGRRARGGELRWPHTEWPLLQMEVEARRYASFQVMYTVGYSFSLGALLLALLILLGLR